MSRTTEELSNLIYKKVDVFKLHRQNQEECIKSIRRLRRVIGKKIKYSSVLDSNDWQNR